METNLSPHSTQESIFLFLLGNIRETRYKTHCSCDTRREKSLICVTFLTNVTENLTELAGGEVYFGSQFRGREDMEIEGASSMVGGAYALLIYILSDKNHAAESERRVGFSFQRLPLVTHLHSTYLLPQSFHNLPKQGCQPVSKSSST